jgi:hypothetical protein
MLQPFINSNRLKRLQQNLNDLKIDFIVTKQKPFIIQLMKGFLLRLPTRLIYVINYAAS